MSERIGVTFNMFALLSLPCRGENKIDHVHYVEWLMAALRLDRSEIDIYWAKYSRGQPHCNRSDFVFSINDISEVHHPGDQMARRKMLEALVEATPSAEQLLRFKRDDAATKIQSLVRGRAVRSIVPNTIPVSRPVAGDEDTDEGNEIHGLIDIFMLLTRNTRRGVTASSNEVGRRQVSVKNFHALLTEAGIEGIAAPARGRLSNDAVDVIVTSQGAVNGRGLSASAFVTAVRLVGDEVYCKMPTDLREEVLISLLASASSRVHLSGDEAPTPTAR